MKIPALLCALSLTAGFAFAQQPNESAKATNTGEAAATAPAKADKATKKHAKKHSKKSSTKSMGAGPAYPDTSVDAPERRQRMDAAYADWKAKQ